MSTLYGNDRAVGRARTNFDRTYPPGSVLSLVTWFQREDEHWFGARIPGQIESIEVVTASSGPDQRPSYSYQAYRGAQLTSVPTEETDTSRARIEQIVSQAAAVMP